MTDWIRFAEALAEQLAMVNSGTVVIISEHGRAGERSRTAQFRQLDNSVWAELSGDKWLDPDVRAGESGSGLIAEVGWRQPDADHGHNWWIERPWPVTSADCRRIGSMVVTGLRDGFRISDPAALSYDAWDESNGNRPMELPLLGLRQQRQPDTVRPTRSGEASMATSGVDPMTRWRALTDQELVELATRLRSLRLARPMEEAPDLADDFGWRDVRGRSDRAAMLDIGFGMASGKIFGSDGLMVEIVLRVTDFTDADAPGRAWAWDTFAAMFTALGDAFGERGTRAPHTSAEARWAGPNTTLVLRGLEHSVQLSLVDNDRLAVHDKAVQLDVDERM